jgi:hypothetical protein
MSCNHIEHQAAFVVVIAALPRARGTDELRNQKRPVTKKTHTQTNSRSHRRFEGSDTSLTVYVPPFQTRLVSYRAFFLRMSQQHGFLRSDEVLQEFATGGRHLRPRVGSVLDQLQNAQGKTMIVRTSHALMRRKKKARDQREREHGSTERALRDFRVEILVLLNVIEFGPEEK